MAGDKVLEIQTQERGLTEILRRAGEIKLSQYVLAMDIDPLVGKLVIQIADNVECKGYDGVTGWRDEG